MLRPIYLQPGDKVALISPSGVATKEQLDAACSLLTSWELEPVPGQHVLSRHGRLAGTDEERLHDLQTANSQLKEDINRERKLEQNQLDFFSAVSHELKTPITSIMGYADTLLEGEYDKETQEKFLGVIASEARRMAKLVTDLLTLSRYDNNKNKTQKESFDLGDLVKKCQDKLAIEIKKKNHTVNCFVTADVPPVYADKYDIERVVLNILTNSIKYTKEGGEIKIYVGFVYNDAYIKIFDNGIGIPEEDLSRIFERFYREDKARNVEGNGLGLAIVKSIVDLHHGKIDILSQVDVGTNFIVRLPIEKQKLIERLKR